MARRRMVFRAVCGVDRRKEEGEAAVWGDGVWQLLLFRTAGWCRLVLRRGWRRVTSPQVSGRGLAYGRLGGVLLRLVGCGRLVAAHGVQRVTVGHRGRRTAKGVKVWCEWAGCGVWPAEVPASRVGLARLDAAAQPTNPF